MTQEARKQKILQTLEEHSRQRGAEMMAVPLRRGSEVLPVIRLPLSVPLLNADSFRIAPELDDHPSAELVRADPLGSEAQKIIAHLVRTSHKHTKELKESLKDGQDEPGLITRAGILINANTRCVLMRELRDEGDLQSDAIRVAVLPADIDDPELMDLEAVVQKQRDHKDPYNLVSELMMLKRLHIRGKMTPQQIGKRQRLPAKDIVKRFEILSLMERARYLVDPPLPLTTFSGQRSKLQNWKELLTRVQDLDARENPAAGDEAIVEWLFAYMLGHNSVHRLRYADGGWIDRHVVDHLSSHGEIGTKLAEITDAVQDAPKVDDRTDLDILDISENASPQPAGPSKAKLLGLAVALHNADPAEKVTLPDGSEHAAADVTRVLKAASTKGLEDSKRRADAGERLIAPENLLKKTYEDFVAANRAIDEAVGVTGFEQHIDTVRSLLDDLSSQLEIANEILDARVGPESANGN